MLAALGGGRRSNDQQLHASAALCLTGLILAAIGIYGVIAFFVSQRTHEIGVRIALGASAASVVAIVVRHAAALAALGVAIGGVVIPKGSSSGIFPRGRYWVILKEGGDSVPFQGTTGAVHKFLVPSENAARGPDVWQSIDITLVGRRIWVVVNGRPVITDQIIPGTTGSAIDGNESAPGPIMLQGEEQRVEFRNITVSVPRS